MAFAFAAVLLGVCLGAWRLWTLYADPGPSALPVQLLIPRASGGDETAALLASKGVIESPLAFALGARIDGLSARLKAGEYLFPAGISARGAAELLASGRTVQRRVTIAEGLTSAQIATLLRAAEGMEGEIEPPAEGSLLPETYFYSWGDARARTLERAQRAMRETLAELWPKRAPDLPFATPHEALVLASIVERETSHADERARVAGVFVNRLRQRMRLQADPTVAYGIDPSGPLGRPLSRADLDNRHRWNTYAHEGLPPTPIANPGRASIEAVLNPARTDDLYFVADGDGRHAFARTLAEHNRNVARLREIERVRGAPKE
ncbi:MAG: endolytic transglycosylase MltG [Rhodospirillales bacterium]|nr:endolytic transglycosylase MltG [Rhodospirillales bacterium]